jgi:glucosamine--fructose-6-phosphate aminotransferase (isomerizing)
LDGKIAVVHNGIFENFLDVRSELQKHGHMPKTETDTECFPLLVSHMIADGRTWKDAFRVALRGMRGKFALVCVNGDHPGIMLLARSGPPLVVGLGDGEYFVASDVTPLLQHTRDIVYLEDGDVGELTMDGLRVFDRHDSLVERSVQRVEWDQRASELGGYQHHMHKEIFEQPEAISRTLEAHLCDDEISLA